MNILLINHYAGSKEYGMEYRPYYLAREWVRQGHKVTIVAASFSHLRQNNPSVSHDYEEETIEGIRYVWMKTPEYTSSISRIINILTFVRKVYKYARQMVRDAKPDLVIASSTYPLDNYPACKIAKMANAKFTYEVHDIWPLSPMLIGGYGKWHPFIMVMQWAEDFAYKHVDKVMSLLWNAEEHMRERGLQADKFVCIPNGYSPEEWTADKVDLALPAEHQHYFDLHKDEIIVGFAGGFAASGAVTTLVKAAVELKDRIGLFFVLVGKGPEQAQYEQIVKEHHLTNVSILPSVPKKLIPAIIKHFDIAYLGGVHSELHKYGTSYNKMTDYMLSGKPIIQAVDEPGSVVERIKCGVRVEAENVKEVVRAIESLSGLSIEEREKMGLKGKEYVEKNLPWSKLAEDFLKPFV